MALTILHACRYCGNSFIRSRPSANRENFCSLACRLWAGVDRSGGLDSCWPWKGALHRFGYGMIQRGKRSDTAHRVAWEVTHGAPESGKYICHRCDNPPCCNPNHLFIGDPVDNMMDMVNKGRHWSKGKTLGEWFRAKLRVPKTTYNRTPEQRRDIASKAWATRRQKLREG